MNSRTAKHSVHWVTTDDIFCSCQSIGINRFNRNPFGLIRLTFLSRKLFQPFSAATQKLLRIGHFTVAIVCSVTWPVNASEAGGDLASIQTSLLFHANTNYWVRIRKAWFTQQKQWGLYQNKVNSSLTAIQRPGARFSKLPVITGPIKLFWFPLRMGVLIVLKMVQ